MRQEETFAVQYVFHSNSFVILKQYCSVGSILYLISCSYIVVLAPILLLYSSECKNLCTRVDLVMLLVRYSRAVQGEALSDVNNRN